MIEAYLFKLDRSGIECDNRNCSHNPEYHYQILRTFFIKKESTCLAISLSEQREVYCRDCIDVVYKKLKPVLDTKLWPFQ